MQFDNQDEMMVWMMTMAACMSQFALTPPPGTRPGIAAASMADEAVVEYRKRGMKERV